MRSKGGDRDEKKILRGLVSSSTLSRSPLLSYGSRGRCQGCLWRPSSSRRLPFQPKVSSDIGGEESALQVALNQSQRQTQWFTEVNPERKVFVVKFDDKWVADSDVIVGIIEEKYPEPSLKTPPEFASVYDLSHILLFGARLKTVSLGNTFATSAFITNKFISLLKTT